MKSGRYELRLPLTNTIEQFGNSRNGAIQRLKQMEKGFTQNPILRDKYIEFMDDYAHSGHMEKIPAHKVVQFDQNIFYLPHLDVFKTNGNNSKIRLVFDASKK